MSDDITLKQVRMIMEQIARQTGRTLLAIEIGEVRDVLGKGNNGTLGGYIKQVKLELSESNSFDRHELSMEFRAATLMEFNRLLDIRTERLEKQRDAINRDHDELLKTIDQVEAGNQSLRIELQVARKDAADMETRLGEELAEAKKQIAASESAKDIMEADIEKIKTELAGCHDEIKALTAKLAKAEAENDALVDGRNRAKEKLHQSHKERENADRDAALAVQAAAHRQEMIDHLRRQNAALEEDVAALKARGVDFERQRDEFQGKLLQAAHERLEDLKQGTVGNGDDKKAAPRPPKRQRQRSNMPTSKPLEA